MTAWAAYALIVGTLLAVTAGCLERVCRLAGLPTRWVWIGSLSLTVVLVGIAPSRTPQAPRRPPLEAAAVEARAAGGPVGVTAPDPGGAAAGRTASPRVTGAMTAVTQRVITAAGERLPASLGRYIGAIWFSVSSILLLLFATVHMYFRRARRRWPTADLHGSRIRIAPETGPAVIGVYRPEIVVPRWLLARSSEEQRLVLVHEREHVRAHDPLLLVVASAVAALLPWHPAVWWMLSRLRLAVELDCDVRVLRRGVPPRFYGALLIDLAGGCSSFPVGVPALVDAPSHLQRRLLALKPLRQRFARTRGGAFAAVALLTLLAACAARFPTLPGRARSTSGSTPAARNGMTSRPMVAVRTEPRARRHEVGHDGGQTAAAAAVAPRRASPASYVVSPSRQGRMRSGQGQGRREPTGGGQIGVTPHGIGTTVMPRAGWRASDKGPAEVGTDSTADASAGSALVTQGAPTRRSTERTDGPGSAFAVQHAAAAPADSLRLPDDSLSGATQREHDAKVPEAETP